MTAEPQPTSSNSLPSLILRAIQATIGIGPHALHSPIFDGREQEYVLDCIHSTYVSSVGEYVDRFERELADYTGAKRAVATVNGTAALQVALQLAGVKANEEVIVPSLTFVATANAAHFLSAVPHFVDVHEETLGMDPIALKDWLSSITEKSDGGLRNRQTGRRIAAVVPMHTFGHPCNIELLQEITSSYGIPMIEDAAEALGSRFNGKHAGTFGQLGCISFNGNKIITTGGGGAIITNNVSLANLAKHLTTTAKVAHRWSYIHDQPGYNFRMPNINAAIGCAQLEQLPRFLKSKRDLFKAYEHSFHSALASSSSSSKCDQTAITPIKIFGEPVFCESNYWLQTLILPADQAEFLNETLTLTNDSGIMTRPAWELLSNLGPYATCPKAPLPVSTSLAKRILNLPSSAGLV